METWFVDGVNNIYITAFTNPANQVDGLGVGKHILF